MGLDLLLAATDGASDPLLVSQFSHNFYVRVRRIHNIF